MNTDDNNIKFPLDDIPLDNLSPEGGAPVPLEATMIIEKPAVAAPVESVKKEGAITLPNDDHQEDMRIEEIKQELKDQPTQLYRGYWTNAVKDGDKIPVGGSILSDSLTTMLTVDAGWIEDQTANFTKESVDSAYTGKNGDQIRQLVESNGIQINPELLHALYQVQKKMELLLAVNRSDQAVRGVRDGLYLDARLGKIDELNLSDLIGKSMCGEQAIVGKILLDKLGIKASLMEGVLDTTAGNEDHAFLVLDDSGNENSLIFDISRPYESLNGFPNISRADTKLTPDVFKGKKDFKVQATSVYDGKTISMYGVGDVGDFVE